MKYTDDIIFIPAVSIATHISVMLHDWKLKGKTARFYLKDKSKDEQLFHHPYMLTSAAHNYKKTSYAKDMGINDLTKDIDMLFGDSGGFQIATGAIKNVTNDTIDQIYTWLETNTTVAPIIDVPPYTTGMSNIGTSNMKICSDKTKENIETLLKRTKPETLSWLNVSHGRTYEQRNYWYKEVNDYNFYDGWAIGSLRRNNYVILSAFASLMDNGELERADRCKLIHFFGLSSMRFVPLMVYLKYKLNKKGYKINVSFDSSYATKDCAYGKYLTMMPDSNGFASYHLSNRLIGKFNPKAKLPCKCPVCESLEMGDVLNTEALKAAGEYYFYNVVQSHNVLLLRDYIDKIQNIIYTDCDFFWQSAFRSDYLKVFKVIDQMFDAPKSKAFSIIQKYAAFLNQDDEDERTNDNIEEMFND